MKRITTIAALFIALCAGTATAEELNFPAGMSRYDAVHQVVNAFGLKGLNRNDGVTLSEPLVGSLKFPSDAELGVVLDMLLGKEHRWEVDADKILQVGKAQAKSYAPATDQVTTQQAARPPDTGDVVLVDGTVLWGKDLRILKSVYGAQYVADLVATENMNRSRSAYAANQQAMPYGSSFGAYGGYDPVYPHRAVQQVVNESTHGRIRLKKGTERFMQHVEIWGKSCNKRLIQADQGNNIWDKLVTVPLNCGPLVYRYSDGNLDLEVEIDEFIPPMSIQSSKNITINDAFFNNARISTERLRYRMVEQPDGSFKRILIR